jgi:hypothetical protein
MRKVTPKTSLRDILPYMSKNELPIREDFEGDFHPVLAPLEIGTGRVVRREGVAYLTIENATANRYSNAQIYDYQGRSRRDFICRPPLRMTVRAWASHSTDDLKGTAGFGFWNQPVMPGQMIPRLPRAVWFFFGSPPSDMALARGVPGSGWKAATIDASRLPFLLLAPAAPLAFLAMRIPALYRLLYPVGQWAVGVSEALITPDVADLREPHTYRLDWRPNNACFYVDDRLILQTPYAPRGPLGFVAWLDNQYAIVTPQGRLGMGLIDVPGREWLALDSVVIETLD